jgi:arylsulfatase A-like enzyme
MSTRISRRRFLGAAGAAAALPMMESHAVRGRKYNLLFLWTDEQRPDTMAVYGNKRIRTPNLDKLASESIVFQNAYVSQPVCTPSRGTVMTGLWPHQHGCTQNNIALAERVPAFPELVGDPDYRTGYFGKWHLGDEVFAQHGFQEWQSIEDSYIRFYREGRDPDRKSHYAQWLNSRGYEPNTSGGTFSREFVASLPIERSKTRFLEERTIDFMRRHRDEPFMLYVNFLEPHMPFTGPLDDLYKPEEVELPANFDDPLEENEPEAYRVRAKTYGADYGGRFDLTQEAGWRRLIANYWGLVTQVDRSVGAILTALEDLGLAEDTVVVFTSDHGDMMGSHKLVEKGYTYQEAQRVPWMIRAPGFRRRNRVVPGHFSHIDLVPTLLELLGAPAREDLPGRSLVPVVAEQKPADEPVYVVWNAPEELAEGPNPAGARRDPSKRLGPSSRTVITPDGWKLSLHDQDRHQLYNLEKDPGETANLYGRDETRPQVERLAGLIHAWQERVGDTLKVEAE